MFATSVDRTHTPTVSVLFLTERLELLDACERIYPFFFRFFSSNHWFYFLIWRLRRSFIFDHPRTQRAEAIDEGRPRVSGQRQPMLDWKERGLRIWRQRVGDIALSVVRDMAKFGRSGWVGHHSVRSLLYFIFHAPLFRTSLGLVDQIIFLLSHI